MAPLTFWADAPIAPVGFWDPPTSTIDWCELNYTHSFYIAEFWNTISNIPIILTGIAACALARREQLEQRFFVLGIFVILVGLGSTAFHATLLHYSQLLDELPMIYAQCTWLFIWIELEHDSIKRPWLVWVLVIFCFLMTVLMVLGIAPIIFQVSFAIMVATGFYYVIRCMRTHRSNGAILGLGVWYLGAFILAFILWICDQFFCKQLNTLSIFPNPQFHAWWHLLTSCALWVGVPISAYARALTLGAQPSIAWFSCCRTPLLPYVKILPEMEAVIKKREKEYLGGISWITCL